MARNRARRTVALIGFSVVCTASGVPHRDRLLQQQIVLATAETVFLQYGYISTTMGDLSDAMQISRPALYLLYPSREAIFAALVTKTTTASAGLDQHDLSAWVASVLDLWLGAASAGGRRDGPRDRQRQAVTLKQQALLCSVLKDGLARRLGAEVGEDFQNAIVQLIALCVRGLQDAQIGTTEGKALLNMQVNALATMAIEPRSRVASWSRESPRLEYRQG